MDKNTFELTVNAGKSTKKFVLNTDDNELSKHHKILETEM